jgi:PTH2 family peptidyl-tRNA hydrolase
MSSKYFRFLKSSLSREGGKLVFTGGELKQVYIVRTDLDMGKGKIAAQCCHAAVKAYRDISAMDAPAKESLDQWEWQGSRKVVVKISSEEELRDVIMSAKKKGLYATTIRDAGKTQIPSGSMTVGVIGPANEKEIDQISGHLKLL